MPGTAVLLVEDSPVDARVTALRLEQTTGHQFNVEHVTRLSEALVRVREQAPDIVLLDLGLPDSSGLATFTALHDTVPDVAIVVLSGLDDELAALEAVRHGAQDFLVKGEVGPDGLRRCVRYAISRAQSERELRLEREYSEAIVSAMAEGFSLTVEGAIVAVNESLCRITGFPRDELTGARPPLPFWPPELEEQTSALWDRLLRAGGGDVELTLMRKTGERFPASVTLRAAKAADGSEIGFASTLRDITHTKHYERLLERLAGEDELTGLPNRRSFTERLQREVARATRRNGPLSLAVLDIDHFKAINDKHGHPIGDRVLVEIAARLRSAVRVGDEVARLGGEEFGWLLPDCDAPGALGAVRRAVELVSAQPFGEAGALTISAGLCDLRDAPSAELLYELADKALYQAKAAGRNRVQRYAAETT